VGSGWNSFLYLCHEDIQEEWRYVSTHSQRWQWIEVGGSLHNPVGLSLEKGPGTYMVGGWVGLRAIWDVLVTRKSLAPPGIQMPNVLLGLI